MVDLSEPFHICEYCDSDDEHPAQPIIDISIGQQDTKRCIPALVDTGCTSALVIPKPFLRDYKLDLGKARKVTREPSTLRLANGYEVNLDIYYAFCRVGDIEKKIKVFVIDAKRPSRADTRKMTAFLGLSFLNDFDVVFKGKEGRILFCHPKKPLLVKM